MKTDLHVLMAIWALIYAFSTYLFFANEFNNVAFIFLSLAFIAFIIFYAITLKAHKISNDNK